MKLWPALILFFNMSAQASVNFEQCRLSILKTETELANMDENNIGDLGYICEVVLLTKEVLKGSRGCEAVTKYKVTCDNGKNKVDGEGSSCCGKLSF